ncbi:MAG: aminoglycoside phosphotransferase family protein [Candidatus Nanohaloarchaeota archaeon QJJ-9]|nr:aminoglycoside phosphotransferase family protein [Candidatus Nanohaloarchaeota archaeon QJJ-9]
MEEKLKALAKKLYGEKPELEKLPSEHNQVYRIELGGETKIAKISPEEGEWKLDKEVYLLEKLSNTEIPVPEIEYQDLEGKRLGNHFYIMEDLGKKNLEGIEENREELLEEAGRILAKVHSIEYNKQGTILYKDIERESFIDYAERIVKNNLEKLEGKLTDKETEKARKILEKIPEDSERRLCHNDFGLWQVMVDDGEISGIIDWEYAMSLSTSYDLAKAEVSTNIFSEGFESIIRGYKRKRNLPENYKNHKNVLKLIPALELMGFFKNQEENYQKAKKVFDKVVEPKV